MASGFEPITIIKLVDALHFQAFKLLLLDLQALLEAARPLETAFSENVPKFDILANRSAVEVFLLSRRVAYCAQFSVPNS